MFVPTGAHVWRIAIGSRTAIAVGMLEISRRTFCDVLQHLLITDGHALGAMQQRTAHFVTLRTDAAAIVRAASMDAAPAEEWR